jgi:osmoprotectant transport system ATP-binding protein
VTHDIDEAIKMGDLVAVMQVGGHLAQFGPPAEILANPANDFVARFVGADRGLKRLSLSRVGELELRTPVLAHPGDDAGEARQSLWNDPLRYLLMVDATNRPIGWVDERAIPREGALSEDLAVGASPLLDRRTTLKDALSMLLDADVQAGLVVDRTGSLLGLVTADMIAAFMREPPQPPRRDEPPP